MTTFKYTVSRKFVSWGYSFDSLTELKYAISIRDEFEFLRARVSIYYHPGTLQSAVHVRECYRRYTPDFLIRHKETGEAFLVEIKPRAFQEEAQLSLRRQVAENYIRSKNYDWKFKVVFDDEIILSAEQLEDFEECRRLRSRSDYKIWFEQYNRKFGRGSASLFKHIADNKKAEFVMFGKIQEKGEPSKNWG